MSNKRQLKRTINLICEELFAECVAASLYGNSKDSAEALLYSTLKLRADYICRISHPEPGMSAKAYFKDLKEKFVAQVSDLADQLNNH